MHRQLAQLIGQRFIYQGKVWILVEVLKEEDALVIVPEQVKQNRRIQADQYGHASRRCQHCLTLPISHPENKDQYSDEVMDLLAGRIAH